MPQMNALRALQSDSQNAVASAPGWPCPACRCRRSPLSDLPCRTCEHRARCAAPPGLCPAAFPPPAAVRGAETGEATSGFHQGPARQSLPSVRAGPSSQEAAVRGKHVSPRTAASGVTCAHADAWAAARARVRSARIRAQPPTQRAGLSALAK